jgi:hypothetical protein
MASSDDQIHYVDDVLVNTMRLKRLIELGPWFHLSTVYKFSPLCTENNFM